MNSKTIRLLLALLALAPALLLASGEARAVTFSYNATLDSVTSSDFTKSVTYQYTFTQNPGSSALSYVDFEIPREISIPVGSFAGATSSFSVTANGVHVSTEVSEAGYGDLGTKFGVGDARYRVLKANLPSASPTIRVVLTLRNQTFASGRQFADLAQSETGAVLIKAGNGSNTQTFLIGTPTVIDPPADPPPVMTNVSLAPNPFTPPECVTATWELSSAATVTIAPQNFVAELTSTSARICIDVPGTYGYQITATGPTGSSSTISFSVTANPAPLYETTCKQVRKNNRNGTTTCVYVCLSVVNGLQQDIVSATWYNNGECLASEGDPGIPLRIYGPSSPEKTLVCTPCEADAPPAHPQACTPNEDPSQPPFRFFQPGAAGNPWKHCDVFRYAVQDEDIGVVLGDDPWRTSKSGTQYWSAY